MSLVHSLIVLMRNVRGFASAEAGTPTSCLGVQLPFWLTALGISYTMNVHSVHSPRLIRDIVHNIA